MSKLFLHSTHFIEDEMGLTRFVVKSCKDSLLIDIAQEEKLEGDGWIQTSNIQISPDYWNLIADSVHRVRCEIKSSNKFQEKIVGCGP